MSKRLSDSQRLYAEKYCCPSCQGVGSQRLEVGQWVTCQTCEGTGSYTPSRETFALAVGEQCGTDLRNGKRRGLSAFKWLIRTAGINLWETDGGGLMGLLYCGAESGKWAIWDTTQIKARGEAGVPLAVAATRFFGSADAAIAYAERYDS